MTNINPFSDILKSGDKKVTIEFEVYKDGSYYPRYNIHEESSCLRFKNKPMPITHIFIPRIFEISNRLNSFRTFNNRKGHRPFNIKYNIKYIPLSKQDKITDPNSMFRHRCRRI